jgi:excinuclease UvrABC ATPase subunit
MKLLIFLWKNEYDREEIVNKHQSLQDVGLGYIKLGQSSSTLSVEKARG